MLPDETESVRVLWPQIRDDYNEAERMHDAIVASFFSPRLVIRKGRGINLAVVHTAMGLMTKAAKTFRAVELAARNGLGEDATTLARSLLETAMIMLFVTSGRPRQRVAMYLAYSAEQSLKMLRQWKRTPGLRRSATKALMATAQSTRDHWYRKLPAGTDVSRHCSGRGSLEAAARLLKHDVSYQLVYRHISRHAHGSDLASHLTWNENDEPVLTVSPGDKHVKQALLLSRVMLWVMAERLNDRLGLGFDRTIAAVKPNELARAEGRRSAKRALKRARRRSA